MQYNNIGKINALEKNYVFWYSRRSGRMKEPDGRLAHPTLEIKKASLSLLYLIGKTILTEYGLNEE